MSRKKLIPEVIKVKYGRFKGQDFRVEGIIDDDLPFLAANGNWAARNAINIDKYTLQNLPFYYGKIGALGYIISEEDLGVRPKTTYVMPHYR